MMLYLILYCENIYNCEVSDVLRLFRITNPIFTNKFKLVSLIIILICNSIIIYTSIGFINYRSYCIDIYDKPELKNADYVSIYEEVNYESSAWFVNDYGEVDIKSLNEKYAEIVNDDVYTQIEKMPAVDKVLSYCVENRGYNKYKDTDIEYLFSNEDTAEFWSYKLSEGCWFKETKQESEYPNAVVCGAVFNDVEVGSDIEVTYNTYQHKIHVIGKIGAPYQTIDLNGEFSLGITNTARVFMLNNMHTMKTFGETIRRYPTSAIVKYNSDASFDDIKKCHQFYEQYLCEMMPYMDKAQAALCHSEMNGKISDSREMVQFVTKSTGISSLIFSFISMFLFVSIIAVMAKGKMLDFCIYYFCGLTKIKSYIIFMVSVVIVTVLAGMISTGIMGVHTMLIHFGLFSGNLAEYVISINCYLFVWLSLIANILVGGIIPFRIIIKRKTTLTTLYKNENGI